MTKVELQLISGKSSLLTRATADSIVAAIQWPADGSTNPIVLNLSGILAMTPSFLDQFIVALKRNYPQRLSRPLRLWLRETPAPPSEKYAAVARSHGLRLKAQTASEWHLEEPRSIDS